MSLVHLRIKPGQTCQHMHTGNPTKPLTFEKSAIFLIKLTTRMKKKIIWTIKPKTYWFYTEKLIYKRENSRDVLLAIKCKDSVGHFVRLVFWSFQMNFMPEYKILSFCDIYHTKLKNLFCLMIYDVTCELFKNAFKIANKLPYRHEWNTTRTNCAISPWSQSSLYIRHAMKTYYLLVYDIYNLKISSFYWYMIYYKPNAKIYNIRR